MGTHPLNVREQLLMSDAAIERVRLVKLGDRFVYYIKTTEGADRDGVLNKVKSLLRENQVICSDQIINEEWEDGPDIPKEYSGLTNLELLELEGSNPTHLGLSNTIPRLLQDVRAIGIESKAGEVRIIIYPKKEALVPGTEKRCEEIVRLLTPVPIREVNIEKREGDPPFEEEPSNRLGPVGLVVSKQGIKDRELLKLYDEDESKFVDAAKKKFFLGLEDIKPILTDGKLACYFPYGRFSEGALRTALIFYERVIIAVPFKGNDEGYLEELSGSNIGGFLSGVRDGYITPLIGQRFGRYDEGLLRAIIDTDNYITPREISIILASDLVVRNPILAVYLNEPKLALDILKTLSQYVETPEVRAIHNGYVSDLLKVYLNVITNSLLNFYYDISNFGIIASTYQGPGPLGAELLRYFKTVNPERLKELPELELAMTGGDLAVAAALNSTCIEFPVYFHKMFQYLSFLFGGWETGFDVSSSRMGVMDSLLTSLNIPINMDVPLSEWLEVLKDAGVAGIRPDLKRIENGLTNIDLAEIQRVSDALSESVDSYLKRAGTASQLVSLFELFGLLGGVLYEHFSPATPKSAVYGGWSFSILLKGLVPSIWSRINETEIGNEITAILEAAVFGRKPNVVRLGRFKRCMP